MNRIIMASERSHQNTSVVVPKFDGLIHRATGKHANRVESYCPNLIPMASETSQQIASVLVPEFDGLVAITTGKQTSGVECD
jgi:hypothetical protein